MEAKNSLQVPIKTATQPLGLSGGFYYQYYILKPQPILAAGLDQEPRPVLMEVLNLCLPDVDR